MVDILELPEVRRLVPRMSVEQYHQTPEYAPSGRRTELICGVIIEKMSKSPLHANLLRRLFRMAQAAAAEAGCFALKEDPITLADSEPEPDVSVVEGREESYGHAHPGTARLVIEVAVTTVELDRAKATIYAEANILEYWLVLARDEAVEVYAAPQGGVYTQRRLCSRPETIVSAALPALQINLDTLFED